MFRFHIDKKAVKSRTGLKLIGLTILFGLLMVIFGEWNRPARYIPRADVWKVVEREAAKYGLEPSFVFAIIAAESSFNERARNQDARGLMQLRPLAWREVSETPYTDAWQWEQNIAVGTAYLGYLKGRLEKKGEFSYPLLAASYRYGPTRVARSDYQLQALPTPRNKIYQELRKGNLSPVETP